MTNEVVASAGSGVLTFPIASEGNAAPNGSKLLLTPVGIALDAAGVIYVANSGKNTITVYPGNSNGSVSPSAVIGGPATGLSNPVAVAVGSSGKIYVANAPEQIGGDAFTNSITVYAAGSNGNVTPVTTITGNNTSLDSPVSPLGLAVDTSGNMYVTDGSQILVFSAASSGNATPSSTIKGGLSNAAGIALDPSGNIYVANRTGFITVYASGSSGTVTPLATISGAATGLNGPQGIAVDATGDIYVSNAGNASVTIYPSGSNGNVAATATISGTNTGLSTPSSIALDSKGNMYVANPAPPNPNVANFGGTITVYAAGSNANALPTATINNPDTQMSGPYGIALDRSGKVYVANAAFKAQSVTVYPAESNAEVIPVAAITGPSTELDFPVGVALDSVGKIYVVNSEGPDGPCFCGLVTVYSPGSNGDATPVASIHGSNTGLNDPMGIAVDAAGNAYVTNSGSPSITIFAAGSSGNVSPSASIIGMHTGLQFPVGIALDSNGNIYVTDSPESGTPSIIVYPAGSNGNSLPSATISGANTGLVHPFGIAVGADGSIYVVDGNSILVFAKGSNANAFPSKVISGINTLLAGPQGIALGP